MNRITLILFCMLACHASTLHARKLYIEPGGEVNALKTAIESLVAGDTLYVKFAKLGQTKKLLKDYAPIVKIGK